MAHSINHRYGEVVIFTDIIYKEEKKSHFSLEKLYKNFNNAWVSLQFSILSCTNLSLYSNHVISNISKERLISL